MGSARHQPSAPPLTLAREGGVPRAPARPARALAVKHSLDRAGAAVLLLLLAPVVAAVALAARIAAPGPVLVRERRVARDGRSFEMLALRPVPCLARWPVDRLPQLFNVLKGEMSFVGPRPERPEFVELFGQNLRRHDGPRRVKPGITGWAQVRALDGPAPLAERVRWDDVYVESWSLWLDAKILARTLAGAVRSR